MYRVRGLVFLARLEHFRMRAALRGTKCLTWDSWSLRSQCGAVLSLEGAVIYPFHPSKGIRFAVLH